MGANNWFDYIDHTYLDDSSENGSEFSCNKFSKRSACISRSGCSLCAIQDARLSSWLRLRLPQLQQRRQSFCVTDPIWVNIVNNASPVTDNNDDKDVKRFGNDGNVCDHSWSGSNDEPAFILQYTWAKNNNLRISSLVLISIHQIRLVVSCFFPHPTSHVDDLGWCAQRWERIDCLGLLKCWRSGVFASFCFFGSSCDLRYFVIFVGVYSHLVAKSIDRQLKYLLCRSHMCWCMDGEGWPDLQVGGCCSNFEPLQLWLPRIFNMVKPVIHLQFWRVHKTDFWWN